MSHSYQKELTIALSAVVAAARVCRTVQQGLSADALEKKDKSPVTIADYASQALICKQIRDAFPNDFIVGEEDAGELHLPEQRPFVEQILLQIQSVGQPASAEELLSWIDSGNHNGTASRYWTLDPIDGTKGFLRKEQYAVSLALLIDHQIQVAVLACPNLSDGEQTGSVFYAVRGEGAFVLPLDDPNAEPRRVNVSSVTDPAQARLCESVESGHTAHDQSSAIHQRLGLAAAPVRMDSQAKYAAVACGMAEIYWRLPTRPGYQEKIWDHAGGVLILEEAGGRVTDLDGRPLDFAQGSTLKENRGVVVTNGHLHQQVLEALR
ncbi:MAG TPA: 3'(2'),5'-bisphosphate nucleotidase [Planctomicrobium sp.]|nr:3'(2'),5'-bisphosphate nucleotidase [Planctomicrobium sp.]